MRSLAHDYSLVTKPLSFYPAFQKTTFNEGDKILCSWELLSKQLLLQWHKLKPCDLEETGPHREKIAALIQRRYGIAKELAHNYLLNFERTLPAN